ncbi:MAG: hypothetical protein AB1757_22470 [Acidobacteriota bacterium]
MKFKALMLSISLIAFFSTSVVPATQAKDHKEFAALSARLSESGGFFDSDNLISNETSYLHVFGKLNEFKTKGGVYIGVGPDQNFTYIAKIRPTRAIMLDIRRDNLLHHLFFKTLFIQARSRIEYLSLLFGKPFPKTKGWEEKDIKGLVEYIDSTPSDQKLFDKTLETVRREVQKYDLKLSETDLRTIETIQQAFYSAGLDIRYSSHNRPPRSIYPTYRDLLLEKDLTGQQNNYLCREDDWQFLKRLQEQDLIIPCTGDLAGTQAMKAVAKYVNELKEKVSAFYVSNVEFYVHRQGQYDKFIENVAALPIDKNSLIIRSYFNYYAPLHPQYEPNHFSTQLLQRIEDLLKMCKAGECETYENVVTKYSIPLR